MGGSAVAGPSSSFSSAGRPRWPRYLGAALGIWGVYDGLENIYLGTTRQDLVLPYGVVHFPDANWAALFIIGGLVELLAGIFLIADRLPGPAALAAAVAWFTAISAHLAGVYPGLPLVPIIFGLLFLSVAYLRRDTFPPPFGPGTWSLRSRP